MQSMSELHPHTACAPCIVGRHLMHTAVLSSTVLWLAKTVLYQLNQFYGGRAVGRYHRINLNPVINLSLLILR